MTLLALDLGTNLGWARLQGRSVTGYGTVHCAPTTRRPFGRWTKFRDFILAEIREHRIDVIAYELPIAHSSNPGQFRTVQVFGGFLAQLEAIADANGWDAKRLQGYDLAKAKKAWTGSGAANKDHMVAEARRRGFRPDTDNAADALAVLHLAAEMAGLLDPMIPVQVTRAPMRDPFEVCA